MTQPKSLQDSLRSIDNTMFFSTETITGQHLQTMIASAISDSLKNREGWTEDDLREHSKIALRLYYRAMRHYFAMTKETVLTEQHLDEGVYQAKAVKESLWWAFGLVHGKETGGQRNE